MSGKEQFKAVRNSHLDNIMTEYGVDKDTAYKALAEVLSDNAVWAMVSEKIANKRKKSPMEQWLDEFLRSGCNHEQTVQNLPQM